MQAQPLSSGPAAVALQLGNVTARPDTSTPVAIDAAPIPSQTPSQRKGFGCVGGAVTTCLCAAFGGTAAVAWVYANANVGSEGGDPQASPSPDANLAEKIGLAVAATLLGVATVSTAVGLYVKSHRNQTAQAALTPADAEQQAQQTAPLELELSEPTNQRI